MANIILLLLLYFIAQSFSQVIRSLYFFEIIGKKYQCTSVGCSPATLVRKSSLRDCEIACLADARCRTLSFDSSNNQCELFVNIPSQYGNLLTQASAVTLITIGYRQIPAPSPIVFPQSLTFNGTGSFILLIVSTDFNNDGHWDLAATIYYENTVSISLGIGDGTFQLPAMSFPTSGTNPYGLVSQDFNNDGNFDLAITNEGSDSISILLGQGNGSFQLPAMTFATGGSLPPAIIVVDVNNDGKIDLAVINTGSNTIGILLGMGNGSFHVPAILYATGSNPTELASGDFNRDGNIDIAVTCRYTTQMLIFLGFGNGSFYTNYTGYYAGYFAFPVKTADFNGDSKLDIVTASQYDSTINIFIGTGTGTFVMASPATYVSGSAPIDIAVQDMNEDSIIDLVVVNEGDNSISIYLGNGNGTFQPPQIFLSGGTLPTSIAIQDFNEDGTYDFAVSNQGSNSICILLS